MASSRVKKDFLKYLEDPKLDAERNMENAGTLQKQYIEEVRSCLDYIDSLRNLEIDSIQTPLPSVVVVGDQSSGKSSLLEHLSSVELPKGSGMVTKCPLIIQMRNMTAKKLEVTYKNAEIPIGNENGIKDAILEAQNKLTDNENQVVDSPITLKLYGPGFPDLTLIDLPGLTQQAVQGQDDSMPEKIKALVMKYMESENTVILCVISANVDAATTVSMKLAQEIDPDRTRTLGVITKCDLLQSDKEKQQTMDVYEGRVIKNSKHGFVLVSCREQNDGGKSISIRESIQLENDFFRNDPIFKSVPEDRVTVESLSKLLTSKLVDLIKTTIPIIKTNITKKLMMIKNELKHLSQQWCGEDDHNYYLQDLFHEFNEKLKQRVIAGDSVENNFNEWRLAFSEIRDQFNKKAHDITHDVLTEKYFIKEIKRRRGKCLDPMFIGYSIFRKPLEHEIKDLEEHAQKCLDKIYEQVLTISETLTKRIFVDIEKCIPMIREAWQKCLEERRLETRDKLKYHLDIEKEFFTQDSNMTEELAKLKVATNPSAEHNYNPGSKYSETNTTDSENTDKGDDTEQIKASARRLCLLVKCYLNIMIYRLSDELPLCILFNFNRQYVQMVPKQMSNLLKNEKFVENSKNNPNAQKAADLKKMIEKLEKAEKLSKEFLD